MFVERKLTKSANAKHLEEHESFFRLRDGKVSYYIVNIYNALKLYGIGMHNKNVY